MLLYKCNSWSKLFWRKSEPLAKYRCFGSVYLSEPVLVFDDQGMRLNNQLSCKKKRKAAQHLNTQKSNVSVMNEVLNYSVQPSHQLAHILSLSFAIIHSSSVCSTETCIPSIHLTPITLNTFCLRRR